MPLTASRAILRADGAAFGWRAPSKGLCATGETMSYAVNIGFDEALHRYYVISSEIPGLWVETETFEEFVEVAMDVVPDLLGDRAIGAKIEFKREVAFARHPTLGTS